MKGGLKPNLHIVQEAIHRGQGHVPWEKEHLCLLRKDRTCQSCVQYTVMSSISLASWCRDLVQSHQPNVSVRDFDSKLSYINTERAE